MDNDDGTPTEWATKLPDGSFLWIDEVENGFSLVDVADPNAKPIDVFSTLEDAKDGAEDYVRDLSEQEKDYIVIDNQDCIKVDEWNNGADTYIMGNSVVDSDFYYVSVNGEVSFEYDYEPKHKEVEEDYLNHQAESEIDRHEVEVLSMIDGEVYESNLDETSIGMSYEDLQSFDDAEKEPLEPSFGHDVQKSEEKQEVDKSNAVNFHITDEQLGIGSAKEKYRRNVEAIHTLEQIESENRIATPEEQEVLSKYVGWGGLADAFDESKSAWANEYIELKALLSPEEYASARESTLNAHYTSPTIIKSIYGALEQLGFEKGNILEPAMGIGNFFGMLPSQMQDSRLYGVELDGITGRIAKQLYPKADIKISGFEKTDYPNDFFDVAIGNVPFGQYKVSDKPYDKHNFMIHDYFFAKTLDKVRPGGVVAFVTSKGTMDGNTDRYGIYQLKDNPELATLRFMGMESLKQMGITKDNFDVIKPENYELIYSGELTDLQKGTQNATLEAIYEKFNIDHPKDYRGHSLSVSDIVVLHQDGENTANFVDSFGFTGLPQFMRELEGDEIIDLGEDREQVMSELKQSIKQEQIETELAFQLADRYIIIQEATEGYEYTIAGTDFKEIDGGVYDGPDMTIREALSEIVEDIRTGDDFLRGNANGESELLPLDYDELKEKIEEANQVVAPSTVIAQFRAKTEELFHNISELNATEIEETVRRHVQAKLEELGINANVIDVVVSGSRARGLEQVGSDLDVVVQLDTAEREDDLFSILNEESLYIGDVKVDINPITEQRTGTLENYLPQVEKYLEQKAIERQEQDTSGHDVQKLEAKITYSVAECSEFHSLGEYHENIASLDEAIKLWEQIPPERLHGIPSIGIQLREIEDLSEGEPYSEMDILRGKIVDLEMLGFYPEIAECEKAMEAIRELIEKIPDIDVIGGNDWLGQDMPGGDKISKLAMDIDQFSYNLDTYEYRDQVEDREAQIASIADDIRNGNVEYLSDFLNAAIADNVSDSVAEMVGQGKSVEESQSVQLIREAKLLLERLAEYKPLAKVEEMEEQNYNMIDNVLNNGAGEKEKKEEKKQDRVSLKARLVEKKSEIEQQSQGKSRTEKKQDREK